MAVADNHPSFVFQRIPCSGRGRKQQRSNDVSLVRLVAILRKSGWHGCSFQITQEIFRSSERNKPDRMCYWCFQASASPTLAPSPSDWFLNNSSFCGNRRIGKRIRFRPDTTMGPQCRAPDARCRGGARARASSRKESPLVTMDTRSDESAGKLNCLSTHSRNSTLRVSQGMTCIWL